MKKISLHIRNNGVIGIHDDLGEAEIDLEYSYDDLELSNKESLEIMDILKETFAEYCNKKMKEKKND